MNNSYLLLRNIGSNSRGLIIPSKFDGTGVIEEANYLISGSDYIKAPNGLEVGSIVSESDLEKIERTRLGDIVNRSMIVDSGKKEVFGHRLILSDDRKVLVGHFIDYVNSLPFGNRPTVGDAHSDPELRKKVLGLQERIELNSSIDDRRKFVKRLEEEVAPFMNGDIDRIFLSRFFSSLAAMRAEVGIDVLSLDGENDGIPYSQLRFSGFSHDAHTGFLSLYSKDVWEYVAGEKFQTEIFPTRNNSIILNFEEILKGTVFNPEKVTDSIFTYTDATLELPSSRCGVYLESNNDIVRLGKISPTEVALEIKSDKKGAILGLMNWFDSPQLADKDTREKYSRKSLEESRRELNRIEGMLKDNLMRLSEK